MAKASAKDGVILVNGYALSTYALNYETNADAGKIDVTGFTDGCQNSIPGLPTASITTELFWDIDADKTWTALHTIGTTGQVSILPQGGDSWATMQSVCRLRQSTSIRMVHRPRLSNAAQSCSRTTARERGWNLATFCITERQLYPPQALASWTYPMRRLLPHAARFCTYGRLQPLTPTPSRSWTARMTLPMPTC